MDKKVNIVLSFDTTGSMYPVLARVRNNIQKFNEEQFSSIPNLKIGVIAHGDYCDAGDPYTIMVRDLTDNPEHISKFVNLVESTYGGDADECYELVLNTVGNGTISWEDDAEKILILIGDASPHESTYRLNEKRLVWKDEANKLAAQGIKIFAVHALASYRSSSMAFYQYISRVTGGEYLTLDQFSEIGDLIQATVFSQFDTVKFDKFVEVIRERGNMTRSLSNNLYRLTKREDFKDVASVAPAGLVPVLPGRFQVMTVDSDMAIRDFVKGNGIEFVKGRGFYELTKHETVQQYKEVIIQDRTTGDMFTGAKVREILGLSPQIAKGGVKESLSSRDTSIYRVFVQSTSYNRKLIAGSCFLYEVQDFEDTGTVITMDIPTPDAPKPKAKTKARATTKAKAKAGDVDKADGETKATAKSETTTKSETTVEKKKRATPKKARAKKEPLEPIKEEPVAVKPAGAEERDTLHKILDLVLDIETLPSITKLKKNNWECLDILCDEYKADILKAIQNIKDIEDVIFDHINKK